MTAQGMYYLIRALVTLIAIPFHEAGHALAAWLLGDPTAKQQGRLSLNPCLLYTSPSPRDMRRSRMPSSA